MDRRPPSRLEVKSLSSELDRLLGGARVSNIYCNTELGLTLLKLNTDEGPKRLLYERGLRACLTDFQYPVIKSPHPRLTLARRLLRGSRVEKVEQKGFDRIVSVRVRSRESKALELVFELLSGGVFVILDANSKILFTTEKRVMKDRSIALGLPYVLPPQTFPSPFDLSESRFEWILGEGPDLGTILRARLGLGNLSDALCTDTGLDPRTPGPSLSSQEAAGLLRSIRRTIDSLKPEPVVCVDDSGPVDYSLVSYSKLTSARQVRCDTVSAAMDYYYSWGGKIKMAAVHKPDRKQLSMRKSAESLLQQSIGLREVAEVIMNEAPRFDMVLAQIKEGKKGELEAGVTLGGVDYEERTAQVKVDGLEAQLDLSKSAAANASAMFSLSKELKARGEQLFAESDMTKTEPKTVELVLKKVRERLWYEKFRWAVLSSSRKLLLGKDAITNEVLVRKHADEEAQVFHSDFVGSPFALVWPPGEMTEKEIREAADITASYTTKAWEMAFSSLDVYWVRGSQLSKSPPSGTYLAKGAFYVAGEKNFVRGARLGVAIGSAVAEGRIDIVAMHPDAVTDGPRAVVVPGGRSNSEISRRLAKAFAKWHSARMSAEITDAIREKIPDKKSETLSVKGL